MADSHHLEIIKRGVDTWNQWRQKNPNIHPDLSQANLSGLHLNKIDLSHAELYKVDLYGAELIEANLYKANLHMAHLYRTNFSDADLTGAVIRGADLVRAKLINSKLRDTDLRWVKLGEANLRGADLTGSAVYGVSAWEVNLDDAIQLNLSITKDGTPTVTVDRLEVAQFIHMLLNYKKLRDVLNSVMERGVLILGRFKNGGIELLQAIAEELRQQSYLPMIFDFDRPDTSDYTETVKTLVSLSKFVIVELSGSSVPQELEATVPFFDIPFVPIINAQHDIYATFIDFLKYDWVLLPIKFSNKDELLSKLSSEIVNPALDRLNDRQKVLAEKHEKYESLFSRKPKGERHIEITEEIMNTLSFQSYRKSALTRARPLTEADYHQKGGIIQTLEGPTNFQPGDYLAQGEQNEEWPITQKHFSTSYISVSQQNTDGFSLYRAMDTRQASQMLEDFTVRRTNGDILTGKSGDYLVRSGNKIWVTNRDIFERSYEPC